VQSGRALSPTRRSSQETKGGQREAWTEGRRMRPVERPPSREIRRRTGQHRETIPRALRSSTPPGYPRPSQGPPQEALKPPIAALASPYGLGPRDDGRFACQPQANAKRGANSRPLTPTRQQRGVQASTGVDTTIAFSLEEALWIKRSQRVRSFAERFAANVVSTSNSTADKRSWCVKAIMGTPGLCPLGRRCIAPLVRSACRGAHKQS
jgi:hypothetical protein